MVIVGDAAARLSLRGASLKPLLKRKRVPTERATGGKLPEQCLEMKSGLAVIPRWMSKAKSRRAVMDVEQ